MGVKIATQSDISIRGKVRDFRLSDIDYDTRGQIMGRHDCLHVFSLHSILTNSIYQLRSLVNSQVTSQIKNSLEKK